MVTAAAAFLSPRPARSHASAAARRVRVATAQPAPAPGIAAQSYLLVDVTSGQTLDAVNADERRDPASLTKLMTAYLVFGALRAKTIPPSQMVNVSERAWRAEGSRMFIEPRQAVHGRRAAARHDRPVGQRRVDRAGRTRRRQRGRVRRADERGGRAARHGEHALHQRHRAVGPAALLDRRRPREARRGGDPRLSRSSTRSTRRRNSATTTSRSPTATGCCGPTRTSTASRPGTPTPRAGA